MECINLRGLFLDYLDGHLGEEELRTVDAHVARCPECHEELSELGVFTDMCRDAVRHPCPDDGYGEFQLRQIA